MIDELEFRKKYLFLYYVSSFVNVSNS